VVDPLQHQANIKKKVFCFEVFLHRFIVATTVQGMGCISNSINNFYSSLFELVFFNCALILKAKFLEALNRFLRKAWPRHLNALFEQTLDSAWPFY
jgi:hypothetical protein